METRMDVQDQLNHIMEKIGRDGRGAIPVPESQLLIVLFGDLADEKHEVCHKLRQNLSGRYKNQEAYQILYSVPEAPGDLKEKLYYIRRNVEKGFLKRTVSYYIPVVFLMADSRLDVLADTITKLKKELEQYGISEYHIDLYGLIAGSMEVESENWQKYKEEICKSSSEIGGLYLFSGDELVNTDVFSRALNAIEMNVFLKLQKGLVESRIWDMPSGLTEGIDKPYEFWKSLSYWRMDLTVCVLCHYLKNLIDKQLSGYDSGLYKVEINRKIEEFFKEHIESKALSWNAMQIPVLKEDLEQVLNTEGGILGFLGKNKSNSYTFKEAVTVLYGDEEYIARFAEATVPISEEDNISLARQLFAKGTLENLETDFLPLIKKKIADLKSDIETSQRDASNRGKLSLGTKISDFERFLQRLYQDDGYGKHLCDLFCKTQEKDLLESLVKLYNSELFTNEREKQHRNKNNLKMYLNQIIEDNMPSNGWEIQSIMSEYPFYDTASGSAIGWQEDIFEYMEQVGADKILSEILKSITHFIEKEGDSVIRIFLEGIQKQRDSRDADPLYLIRGVSYCQERNRREFLLGNTLFMNSEILKNQNSGALFERIRMIPCNTSFPFTLEFFGINDSATTRGIKGL